MRAGGRRRRAETPRDPAKISAESCVHRHSSAPAILADEGWVVAIAARGAVLRDLKCVELRWQIGELRRPIDLGITFAARIGRRSAFPVTCVLERGLPSITPSIALT